MRHKAPLGFILIAIAIVTLSFCIRASIKNENRHINRSEQMYLHAAQEESTSISQVSESLSKTTNTTKTRTVTTRDKQTDKTDVDLLARIIYCEAGGCTYRHKQLVGSVVINRMNHHLFPDTLEGVIFQKGQYYPAESNYLYSVSPDLECYEIAQYLLAYGASDICPSNVLFQAEFIQGDIYEVIVSPYGSTTYFCYG